MRSNKLGWAVALLTVGVIVQSASADLLVHEPFAYEDGWLTGKGGALGTTGTWTAHDTHNGDWRIHQEGDTSGIVVDPGPPVVRGMFDGLVDNLATSGGYVGLPGPLDLDPPRGEDEDFEIGRNMDASIALDPAVTATFQSGTTTWISYVSARAWDRNEEQPNLVLGTDPAPTGSRGDNYGGIGTGFSGFGTGGGPTRNNRTDIYPMFYNAGQYSNVNGAVPNNAYNQADFEVSPADGLVWQEFDTNGEFGAPNIVVMKLEWDADGGKDIISVASFLEGDTLSEANFDALITAQPNLSSANWVDANKPSLTQGDLDTITFMGLKYFVDEIRIATTFDDVISDASSLAGDFNGDGIVDRADVADIGAAYGSIEVDLSVLALTQANLGNMAEGSPAAVPEPTTLTMALLSLLGLIGVGRHRKR